MDEDGFVLVPRSVDEECDSESIQPRQDNSLLSYLVDIDGFVDSIADSLWPLNKFIHDNPELAFQEHKAHKALTDFIRSREGGWQVITSAYGLETAWVAAYDSGKPGPVVSFNAEMGV
jgi:hypothetical protein